MWKVGEISGRTGLSVRTLHHYDAIGLLVPSGRTSSSHGSGHRLYTQSDLVRLVTVHRSVLRPLHRLGHR